MLLLGLTGSIATGKSTVSSLLRAPPYNLPIVDADVIARQVVEPGTAGYAAIVAHFGPTTPDLLQPASTPHPTLPGAVIGERGADGKGRPLDRAALGRRVFGAGAAARRDRAALNRIVHPAVRRRIVREIVRAYVRGCWAVVLDIPLLFESGWERYCGVVMVVAVSDPVVQVERLRRRDPHLTEAEAWDRVRSQGMVAEKVERVRRRGEAGVVVWNDGAREDLERELARVMGEVRRRSPLWWSWLLWVCPPLAGVAAVCSWWRMRRVQLQWEEEQKREKAKL